MDISKIVSDDVLFPVELKHPFTKEPLGITFWIEPFAEADRHIQWGRAEFIARKVKSGETDVSADDLVDIEFEVNRRRCLDAVKRWDWGDNSFNEIGADTPCTKENIRTVLFAPKAEWITRQLYDAGVNVRNFFPKSSVSA